MKILYYDCFAGISGDMHLGALLDLGVDFDYLLAELDKLPVEGYEISMEQDIRKGISGKRIKVILDRNYLDQHDHETNQPHKHEQLFKSSADQHQHDHNTSNAERHQLRSFFDIRKIIEESELNNEVKEISLNIFTRIAEAEGKIHNKPVDDVHFHEVGAVDSIVDIVGAAICLQKLAPDAILSSTVEVGSGFVNCAHGLYPVPAPATAEILKNIPVHKGLVDYEATTPTGAAIISSCVNEFTNDVTFKVNKVGYGIGEKDGAIPNVLRIYMGEKEEYAEKGVSSYSMIECNMDDMNPEHYDYVCDMLYQAGAMDVYLTPIIMKKFRPAITLSVTCNNRTESGIYDVLFKETSTIGIRKTALEKKMLEVKNEKINSQFGKIEVKVAYYQGILIRAKPEYSDCQRIAKKNKIPLIQVYKKIESEIFKTYSI